MCLHVGRLSGVTCGFSSFTLRRQRETVMPQYWLCFKSTGSTWNFPSGYHSLCVQIRKTTKCHWYFYFKVIGFFFWLCFVYYAITIVPIWLPLLTSNEYPQSLRQSPHHYSCPWVMCVSSLVTLFPILYFTSLWLFCNYLLVSLNPLTFSPIPLNTLLYGNHQNALCIHLRLCFYSCLLSLFFRFNCWQICIYCHFIVHSFASSFS